MPHVAAEIQAELDDLRRLRARVERVTRALPALTALRDPFLAEHARDLLLMLEEPAP